MPCGPSKAAICSPASWPGCRHGGNSIRCRWSNVTVNPTKTTNRWSTSLPRNNFLRSRRKISEPSVARCRLERCNAHVAAELSVADREVTMQALHLLLQDRGYRGHSWKQDLAQGIRLRLR